MHLGGAQHAAARGAGVERKHERLQDLAAAAREAGKTNVAFLANFLLQNVDACIDILVAAGRAPEATFFARAYRPSRVDELVKVWQEDLKKVNAKAAESLASPTEYPNLFPDWEAALKVRVQYQIAAHSLCKVPVVRHACCRDRPPGSRICGRAAQVCTGALYAAWKQRAVCCTWWQNDAVSSCAGSCALRSFAGGGK